MRRAFIYTRVSTTKQDEDGAGADVQLKLCQAYAVTHGFEVIRVYDEVFTGTKYRERPKLAEMRRLVRERAIDAVIFYDVSRLGRKQAHVAILMDEADEAKVEYHFVAEPFDRSAVGMLILGARAFAAELEREKIVARTQGGLQHRVESGKLLPGRYPPYGYVWQKNDKGKKDILVVHEEHARVLRRIYQELVHGVAARQIAKRLNDEGIRTQTGMIWRSANICKMVRNPIYMGEPRAYRYKGRLHRETDGQGPRGGLGPLLEGTVVAGAAPAIVDAATWHAAIGQIEQSLRRSVRNNQRPEAAILRNGFAVCGYCGKALRAQNPSPAKLRYRPNADTIYTCNSTNRDIHGCPHFVVSASVIDNAAWTFIIEKLQRPEEIIARLEMQRSLDPTIEDRGIIDRELSKIERQEANLRRSLADVDDDDFRTMLLADANQLSTRKKGLRGELAKLDEERARWSARQQQSFNIEQWLTHVASRLSRDATYEHKRWGLQALGVVVRVWATSAPQRATIEWSLPLSDETNHDVLITNTCPSDSIRNRDTVRVTWADLLAS